ncbi:Gfo/Idh/MocA family protein [Georgenia faecalis]|uniref:Gfo/Idh/MocA family protein n=1 Tax=Georgenia faecalis TaxID=2483799 RepID=A0ABV9D7G3_9MICO|nr:Gfo/Idh/MocA family oxidoreductase [Georgenia faecalis]
MTGVPAPVPAFPHARLGVAVLGCGSIAQSAHLPAYTRHGVDVVGVWSRDATRTEGIRDRFPAVRRVYRGLDELVADPDVDVVDIATGPVGRLDLVAAAVRAGKHVLAQKPVVADAEEIPVLEGLLAEAAERGVRVAVNQNGRWAPAWRVTTALVREGAVGEVVGVTHLHDKPLPPIAGTPFDRVPHMLLTDYLVHWVDITRCWLEGRVVAVITAQDSRLPGQPADAANPWHATMTLACEDGASAVVRVVGDVRTRRPACPYWVHGTDGTIRGSVLGGSDAVALERDGTTTAYALEGEWFVDGFAGAMAELMRAVDEGRAPEHDAAHVLATARLVLAARDSAAAGGVPQSVRVPLTRPGGRA